MIGQLYPNHSLYTESSSDTMKIINAIEYATSIEKFKMICSINPNYKIESESYNGYTILTKAIDCNNFNLAKHIVTSSNDKKKLLESVTSRGTPLSAAIVKLNLDLITFLIESGANVKNPELNISKKSPHEDKCSSLVNRALNVIGSQIRINNFDYKNDLKIEIKTKIVKLLLENGAQPAISFTKSGVNILIEASKTKDFCLNVLISDIKNIDKLIKIDSYHEDRIPLIEARNQLLNEKFNFLSESKENISPMISSPKDFIVINTTNEQNNVIDKKKEAEEMMNSAIKKICKNQSVFLCAFRDKKSIISSLPLDIINFILGIRISIDL